MADEPLPKSGIYCIRNLVSGRIYVGSAIKIRSRWNTHRHMLRAGRHHSRILQRSWNKHSETAFAFEVLEAVADVTNLIRREQHWIDRLNAACPKRGLNAYPTAGSPLGRKVTPETKAKMSAAHRGKKYSPRTDEHRTRLSAAKKGSIRSMESRRKQSASTKGTPIPLARLAKHRAILAARNRRRSTGDLKNQLNLPI